MTDENKKDYAKIIIYHKLVKEMEDPVNAFNQGFHRFGNPEYLKIFTAAELDKLLARDSTIDFEDFKTSAHYEGYSKDLQEIVWFWEVAQEFDQENLSALWLFASGRG